MTATKSNQTYSYQERKFNFLFLPTAFSIFQLPNVIFFNFASLWKCFLLFLLFDIGIHISVYVTYLCVMCLYDFKNKWKYWNQKRCIKWVCACMCPLDVAHLASSVYKTHTHTQYKSIIAHFMYPHLKIHRQTPPWFFVNKILMFDYFLYFLFLSFTRNFECIILSFIFLPALCGAFSALFSRVHVP